MIVKIKNLRHDGVGDGTLVLGLEPRHPFRPNTKHVDVQVLSDVINIYIQNKKSPKHRDNYCHSHHCCCHRDHQ